MEERYFHLLPHHGKIMVEKIERYASLPVYVGQLTRDLSHQMNTPVDVPSAWVNEEQAGICFPNLDQIDESSFLHELLHIYLNWVKKAVCFRHARHPFMSDELNAFNNDCQHLWVIPKEIEICGLREEHWRKSYASTRGIETINKHYRPIVVSRYALLHHTIFGEHKVWDQWISDLGLKRTIRKAIEVTERHGSTNYNKMANMLLEIVFPNQIVRDLVKTHIDIQSRQRITS